MRNHKKMDWTNFQSHKINKQPSNPRTNPSSKLGFWAFDTKQTINITNDKSPNTCEK
jgi:hypothetical protein